MPTKKNDLNMIQAWMTAVRARTIPIPTIQVMTGTALAYAYLGSINWLMVFFTWVVAVMITFGTNLINDVYDIEKGGDHENRVGHLKVIRAGLISQKMVFIAGLTAFGIAILFSIPLAAHAGWGIFFLVTLCATIGYGYTGGPYPICYMGLSEVFILLFYGFVLVGASFYVQTGYMTGPAYFLGFQMGLLAILPNALNNFRDMYEDAEVKKLTFAVKHGATFARWEIALLTAIPFILCIGWLVAGYPESAFMPLLLTPMAFLFVRSVWTTKPGPLFNRYFALSVLIHFFFGLLMVVGFLLR